MERRRLQHRRMKQQKRICTSQPDLTKDDHHQQHHQSLTDLSAKLETSILTLRLLHILKNNYRWLMILFAVK